MLQLFSSSGFEVGSNCLKVIGCAAAYFSLYHRRARDRQNRSKLDSVVLSLAAACGKGFSDRKGGLLEKCGHKKAIPRKWGLDMALGLGFNRVGSLPH